MIYIFISRIKKTFFRTRTCTKPKPEGLGYNCSKYGPEREEESCDSGSCSGTHQ